MKQVQITQTIPTYRTGLIGVWDHLIGVIFSKRPVLLPREYKLVFWCEYSGKYTGVELIASEGKDESL